MKVVKLHEWTTKQFLSPILNTKIAQKGPKKSKQQNLSQNQMSELKETKKMKVAQIHD